MKSRVNYILNRYVLFFALGCACLLSATSFAYSIDTTSSSKKSSPTSAIFTEQSINERITQLAKQNSSAPNAILEELDRLILLSEKNSWSANVVKASVVKAEVFARLENVTEAQKIIDANLPLAKQLGLEKQITRLELTEVSISVGKKASIESLQKRQAILAKADSTDDIELAAEIYMVVGQSEYAKSHTTHALKHLKQAYQLASQVDAHNIMGETLSSLANIYVGLDDPETALDYYRQCLELNKIVKSPLADTIILYNMGKAYLANEKLEQAKKHFELSLDKSISIKDELGIGWSRISLAELAIKEQRLKDAIKYLDDASSTIEKSGDKRIIFRLQHSKALSHIGLAQLDKAKYALQQMQQLSSELEGLEYLMSYHHTHAKFLSALGSYKEALNAKEKYAELLKKSFLDKQRNIVQKYRVQFDSEFKENQNRVLVKDNELKNLKIKQQESEKQYWLLIVILAGIIIVIVIFLLFKQIDNRNQFRKMALRDYLTKSPNRRAILREAEERFNRSLQGKQPFSIGIVDFDKFKTLNDTYGHEAGDQVLQRFAQACLSVLRKQDAFGRYGGEEWLIVFSDTQKEYIHSIFDRLTEALNKHPITGIEQAGKITFSMGVAELIPEKDATLSALISRADANLYIAKENGRDQVVL